MVFVVHSGVIPLLERQTEANPGVMVPNQYLKLVLSEIPHC